MFPLACESREAEGGLRLVRSRCGQFVVLRCDPDGLARYTWARDGDVVVSVNAEVGVRAGEVQVVQSGF